MWRKRIIVTLFFAAAALTVFCQPGAGDPVEGGAKPGTVPISGIEILIGLGGLLGAKKIFDSKRKGKG